MTPAPSTLTSAPLGRPELLADLRRLDALLAGDVAGLDDRQRLKLARMKVGELILKLTYRPAPDNPARRDDPN